MKRPTIRKHLSDQMIEAIVDEYEAADIIEDRREYCVQDFMSSESITEGLARKLQNAVHKRIGLKLERNF